jgi:hypothetical protein
MVSNANEKEKLGRNDKMADRSTMQRFLAALFPAGGVVELRCPKHCRGKTTAGYFDDHVKLLDAAARLSGQCPGVYATLNPVNPALLARANNQAKQLDTLTGDVDIIRRTALLIDADPVRPTGIPSTEQEHTAAIQLTAEIRDWLSSQGWPLPLHGDSGNGAYLIFQTSLANNDGATKLVKRGLLALAARFNSEAVHIDTGVYNAARIVRLLGTRNCKGDGTPDRPHRRSGIITMPGKLSVVPADLLDALARMAPPEEPPRSQRQFHNGISAEDYLRQHGLAVSKVKPWQGGTLYELATCPFNAGHTGTARVIQFASGAINFGCFHESCQGRDWHSLRDLKEPGRQDQRQTHQGNGPAYASPPGSDRAAPSGASDKCPQVRLYRPFPTKYLPKIIRPFVEEGAQSLNVDPAFVALPTLSAVAACIGNTTVIEPWTGWIEPCVLWTTVIADSGTLKTPSHKLPIRALNHKQFEFWHLHEEAVKKYKAEKAAGGTPAEPAPQRRCVVRDVTVEKLACLLQDTPRGPLVARDELTAWVNSFKQYKSKGSDVPQWLEMSSAGTITVDRVGRPSLIVPRAGISLTGGIQPKVFGRCFIPEYLDSGLIARILLANPPAGKKEKPRVFLDPATESAYETLIDALLEAVTFREVRHGESRPHVLRFDKKAQQAWDQFFAEFAERQGDSEGYVRMALAKIEGYAARLTLLHHIVESLPDYTKAVGVPSVVAGVTLALWFADETERIYASYGASVTEARLRDVLSLVQGRGGQISIRELQRARRTVFATADAARDYLEKLVEAGYGKWRVGPEPEQGGHQERFFVLLAGTGPDTCDTRTDADTFVSRVSQVSGGILGPEAEEEEATDEALEGFKRVG